TFASDWVSPDKQWEYKFADNKFPEIVKTGTTQVVLGLDKELDVPSAQRASRLIWCRIQSVSASIIVRPTRLIRPMTRLRFFSCVAINGWHCVRRWTTLRIGAS